MTQQEKKDLAAIQQEAKQLFVHGLLRFRASKESKVQKEERINRILAAIRESSVPAPIPLAKRILLVAASVLAILFAGKFLFLSGDPQVLEAELLSNTLKKSRQGIHYFEGSFSAAPRGRRIRRSFEAYFGPNKAFALEIFRPFGSITLGSDGNSYWIRSRHKVAIDLPFLPKDSFPLLGIGSNLSYLEVRPLLESVLDPDSKPLTHSFEGDRIHIQGVFRFPAFFQGHPLAGLSHSEGEFDLWIDKDTSLIQKMFLRAKTSPDPLRPPFQLRLERKPTPAITSPEKIFSPKRVYIPPHLKAAIWGANLLHRMRKRRERLKARRAFRRAQNRR
ncbi:MAG TPA: hypothetical protein ENK02_04735 [Planctomycetes bacterium]|nr:hypothetical protein [Planctomycetota bacterium]